MTRWESVASSPVYDGGIVATDDPFRPQALKKE
jgi:hypothetical protein